MAGAVKPRLAVVEPMGAVRPARIVRRALRPHYSRFVGAMKVLLPAAAAALLGLIVIWPRISPHEERNVLGFAKSDAAKVDTLSIRNPRYFGTDQNNLPYTVTAEVATQLDPENTVVTLEKPVADFTRADGRGLVVDALTGFYRQHDDTLDLMGHVDVYRDDGYELHTESARVYIGRGDASGDQHVEGQGPTGTLSGDGFTMKDRGRLIVFTGKSRAELVAAPAGGKP